ncbi:TRAP transporter small permease [Peijinzhouia sedimentorum]|mgnify:CR=1 FL=1
MNSGKLRKFLDHTIEYSLVVLMILMILNVSWQVFSRYFLSQPSSFTDELSRYTLIWLGMLGAAYVSGRSGHLAIDILPQSLKGASQVRLQILIYAIVVFFVASVMVIGGGNLVYITYTLQQKSATLQIPLAYIYSIIPISGLFVVYYQWEKGRNAFLTFKNS